MWRIYWTWKSCIDDYSKTIDIKFLKKYWYLDKWIKYKKWWLYWKTNWEDNWNIWIEINKEDNNWFLRVFFTQTSYDWIKKELNYKIQLISSPCNYWWVRWWLVCPCWWWFFSTLYLQKNWYFASRKTLNLVYDKQRRSKKWRAFNNIFISDDIEKIRETIKYPYRNWKPTRKMRKIFKLKSKELTLEQIYEMEKLIFL